LIRYFGCGTHGKNLGQGIDPVGLRDYKTSVRTHFGVVTT